jgi:rRNA maturation RNase YbeY
MYDIAVINAHPRTRLRRTEIVARVEDTLRREGVPQAQVNVIFVSDDELLEMNREHLQHDYFTDVITFKLEDDPLEGEIYISLDRAREQASEYGIGLYDEVKRLAIHGALHLCGYDDATDAEREQMRRLEDRYLSI